MKIKFLPAVSRVVGNTESVALICNVIRRVDQLADEAMDKNIAHRIRHRRMSLLISLLITTFSCTLGFVIVHRGRYIVGQNLADVLGYATLVLGIGTMIYGVTQTWAHDKAKHLEAVQEDIIDISDGTVEVWISLDGRDIEVNFSGSSTYSEDAAIHRIREILN